MENLSNSAASLAPWIMQLLSAAMLAILFLQSGLDKVFDRKGNLEYFTSHFANSPLAAGAGPLLLVMTIVEVTAGALSALGVLMLLFRHDPSIAFWGAAVSGAAITCLFFGQRVAKDYAGAATLVPYFLLALVGMYLQSA